MRLRPPSLLSADAVPDSDPQHTTLSHLAVKGFTPSETTEKRQDWASRDADKVARGKRGRARKPDQGSEPAQGRRLGTRRNARKNPSATTAAPHHPTTRRLGPSDHTIPHAHIRDCLSRSFQVSGHVAFAFDAWQLAP